MRTPERTLIGIFVLLVAQFALDFGDHKSNFAGAYHLPLYPTIEVIHGLIQDHVATCQEIIEEYLQRIDVTYDKINAIANVNQLEALDVARKMDKEFRNSHAITKSLFCIPIIIKDNIDQADGPPTLNGNPGNPIDPPQNALVVDKLIKEGAVIVAKARMNAFAAVFPDINDDADLLCHNPYDLDRTCSGSSSGSGAAVAAGLAVVALGTDTAGSVIYPAAVANAVGIRPATGEVNDKNLQG